CAFFAVAARMAGATEWPARSRAGKLPFRTPDIVHKRDATDADASRRTRVGGRLCDRREAGLRSMSLRGGEALIRVKLRSARAASPTERHHHGDRLLASGV